MIAKKLFLSWGVAFLLPVWFIPCTAYSAPPDNDSLRQVVATQADSPELTDNLFTIMRNYHRIYEYDSAMAYSEKLFAVATRIENNARAADALYFQSMIHEDMGDLNDAFSLISEYLRLVRPLNDTIRLAKGYIISARIMKVRGQKDSAIFYLRKNMEMGKNVTEPMLMIVTTNEMGTIYQDLNVYDSAVQYYLKSGRLCEKAGLEQHLGSIYNNLGKTFAGLKQYDEAIKYLESSLAINRQNNDDKEIVLNLINLGFVYLHLSEFEKCEDCFKQAADVLKNYPVESLTHAQLYNSFAELYEIRKRYPEALLNLDKALAIFSRETFLDGIIVTLVNKGNIYTAQGKYLLAQAVLDSSLRIAKRAGSLTHQKSIIWAISENYHNSGDHKLAYEYYVKYHQIYDTLYEIERANRMAELSMQYNNERIQKENLALKNNNLEMQLNLRKKTNQSNIYLFAGIVLIIFALFLILYLRQRIVISRQKIQQLEEEKKLLGAKLLLEGQEQERKRIATDLHDGLGVLLSATKMQFSSIRDKSPENIKVIDRAMQLLDQATGDVRKISHNMMPGLLTKLGLYEAVEDLFENIADSGEMEAQCEISEDMKRLPENSEIMIYRIIQEWVNNTFKHARARHIGISIKPADGNVLIDYHDDGIGYEVDRVLKSGSGSLGLMSIQSRVEFSKWFTGN